MIIKSLLIEPRWGRGWVSNKDVVIKDHKKKITKKMNT